MQYCYCSFGELRGALGMGSVADLNPQSAAEKAVSVIGLGYDLCRDIRFSSCKTERLIDIDQKQTRDAVFPGGVVVSDVPTSIKCDKGERTRFRSDVLTFNQMSNQFNQELSLLGKIPSGLFNAMFDMKQGWSKDASSTKALAFDGWFITLYNIGLDKTHMTLSEKVIKEVPSSWDPAALAGFIDKYGTHIIVGVKMGGKDVVHMKQLRSSDLQPTEVQKLLKQLADERFSEDAELSYPGQVSGNLQVIDATLNFLELDPLDPTFFLALKINTLKSCNTDHHAKRPFHAAGRPVVKCFSKNDDIVSISVRRGGIDTGQPYNQWLSTISQSPSVISMSFVPLTMLLNSVPGNGFLSHAMNLYLRYKPPIEELHQFLEYQLPRRWAPVYGDLPLGFGAGLRKKMSPSLKFSLTGPKLYVNTAKVDSKNRPVTGIRLYLEGKKSDQLGIHLLHLSELPGILSISDDHEHEPIDTTVAKGYYEAVKCRMFSHVCTAPVQYNSSHIDESAAIVTKAWLEVKSMGMKKVLFLNLGFSAVASATIRRSEWDGTLTGTKKSGFFSALMSTTRLSKELASPVKPEKVDINSAVYQGGPPVPTRAQKMLSLVDTNETVRGPEDLPGYWVVTGAKLCVNDGRISIKAKYSLLTIISNDLL
ncbi:MACPF domain-containing protein NSL1-like [Neltuma alba]|uniref:MACPF domain-containing protein NSL1-like n=1 Tax=Neltuma alba TaxID=207710 RepID=UPI0010A30C10|nr:MACPF domain-containing protein NSL1-like [Prosopis alba]